MRRINHTPPARLLDGRLSSSQHSDCDQRCAQLLPVDGSYQQSQPTSIVSQYNISIDRVPIPLDTIGIDRYSIPDTGIVRTLDKIEGGDVNSQEI